MLRARGATLSCPARSGRCVDVVILCQPPGVECKGCAEKTELVKRVRETMHLPLKPEEPTGKTEGMEEVIRQMTGVQPEPARASRLILFCGRQE